MKEEKDYLTEFENAPQVHISWFSIILPTIFSIIYFVLGFLYYEMWKHYQDANSVVYCCVYFPIACFTFINALWLTIAKTSKKK